MGAPKKQSLLQSVRDTFLTYENAKTALFWYIVFIYFGKSWRYVRSIGIGRVVDESWKDTMRFLFRLILKYPPVKRKVESQLAKAREDMELKLGAKSIPWNSTDIVPMSSLPLHGQSPEWIYKQLDSLLEISEVSYEDGRVSGAVYHGGEDVSNVIREAFNKYTVSNPLHPDVFPGIRKMEAEVVAMCLRLFNAPVSKEGQLLGAGTTTSGGTESILMACKAYRDWAREVKGITEPEMVVPISAHAAFLKAGHYFGIKCVTIPADPKTRKVNLYWVKRAINKNTCMLVGSAPNFGDGIIDDIVALSSIAKKKGLPLHVDCCLGSFLVPFLGRAGYETEMFDFRLEGVTSISCDTHKYGFAPKGSSVILYRSPDWRRYQYFTATSWPGGMYPSPSMAGSRPGSLIAGTWATLVLMGEDGYLESCKSIVGAAKAIVKGIRDEIPELYVLGDPKVSVVAFGSKDEGKGLDIHLVGDQMSKKGWHLNGLQYPAAVHIACTRLTVPHVREFLEDLKDAVKIARENPPENSGTMVQLYGLGRSAAAGPGILKEIMTTYLDVLYTV